MAPRIVPALTPREADALLADARSERRDPRDHAALLIVRALELRGLLPIKANADGGQAIGVDSASRAGDATPASVAGLAQPATSQGARHAST